jgi:hypothetical protein
MKPNAINSVAETVFEEMLMRTDATQNIQKELLHNQMINRIATLRTQNVDELVFNTLRRLFEGNDRGYASLTTLSKATGLSRTSIVNSTKRLIIQERVVKYSDFSPTQGYLTNFFVILGVTQLNR